MENNIDTTVRENTSPFLILLYTKRFLIILFTLIFASIGFCYAKFLEKPTYKASRAVILRTVVGDLDVESSISYEASLAKIYLPIVKDIIISSKVINRASQEYLKRDGATTELNSGAVSIVYGEKSMIFSMSYTDSNPIVAEEKLEVLIQVASEMVPEGVEAEVVSLIPTQNDCNISENRSFLKLIALFTVLGVVLIVGYYGISYVMDNTIKSKVELEMITNSSVLAKIDYYDKQKTLGKKEK